MDGAVRTIDQAKFTIEKGLVNRVILFTLNQEEAEKRLINRMKNSEIKRSDDNLEVFKKRFEVYRKQTEPILDYLKSKVEKYHEVDASPSIDKIHEVIKEILKLN